MYIFFYIFLTMSLFINLLFQNTLVISRSLRIDNNDINIGVGTSAYQIEGAWNVNYKSKSIWDTFVHSTGKIYNDDTGDDACEHYYKYKDDIKLLNDLGIKNYRFSISWPRILPNGDLSFLNQEGLNFYNNLIDELIKNNITPYVTMFHWDLPQALQDKYRGMYSDRFVKDFVNYADILFGNFGDRVKYWITLNEPLTVINLGFTSGVHAPGIKSDNDGYIVAHNQLLAHAHVYNLYHTKYKDQLGKISIALNCDWMEPASQSPEDKAAAQRGLLWNMGLFADPIFYGDYPEEVKNRVTERLPKFNESEKNFIKGSIDFFSLNHYTGNLISNNPNLENCYTLSCDPRIQYSRIPNTLPTMSSWQYIYPDGIYNMLGWIKERYNLTDMEVIISENGVSTDNSLEDITRIDFITNYYSKVNKAKQDFVINITTYFIWSFMDNFEWAMGYKERYGIVYVDFNSENKTRILKNSAQFVKKLIN